MFDNVDVSYVFDVLNLKEKIINFNGTAILLPNKAFKTKEDVNQKK